MSASESNLDKQKRRHMGPIIGMVVVVIFALGLLFWLITDQAAVSPGPQGTGEAPASPSASQTVTPGAPSAPDTGNVAAPGPQGQPVQPTAPTTPLTPAPAN